MIAACLAALSCSLWIYLIAARGRFWRVSTGEVDGEPLHSSSPRIAVVVPARDEAESIGESVSSLLRQDYAGPLQITVVDDHSSDLTVRVVEELAAKTQRLKIISSAPLRPGWTGKMWAICQGIREAASFAPDYFLFSDADVVHSSESVRALVSVAEHRNLDLVSRLAKLSCSSFAERALIPAFVFYFFMLYPPQWVRDPKRRIAAAAGGNVLVRVSALTKIGGIEAIHQELIDDCALAREIKKIGAIELGWATNARSIRRYAGMADIGRMISRNAFYQLRHSIWLLIASLLGLAITYVIPPLLVLAGGWASAFAAVAWLLMSIAFWPTLKFYSVSPFWAPLLPLITLFYAAATLHSAVRYWLGRGGEWKGRTQDPYASLKDAKSQPPVALQNRRLRGRFLG